MKIGTLCYVKDNGKTLMIHRVKREDDIHKGKWNGLGGKVESGETPEECVIREIYEESGLKIRNPVLRGFLTFPEFAGDYWFVFVYTATEFDGRLIESEEGVIRWIDDSDIKKLRLWDGDLIFLEWIAKEKFFSAKFNYDGEKLRDYNVVFHDK
jgi:8-oxo-dGTP diphosphatase